MTDEWKIRKEFERKASRPNPHMTTENLWRNSENLKSGKPMFRPINEIDTCRI
jgi:hypothetical protein